MNNLEPVLAHLESNFEGYLNELLEFASIPSVSTDPAFKPDVARAGCHTPD